MLVEKLEVIDIVDELMRELIAFGHGEDTSVYVLQLVKDRVEKLTCIYLEDDLK